MPYSPMQLAEAFIKTGELTDALDALNQQLQNQPDDMEARRLRASVLLRLGKPEQLQMALDDLNALPENIADDNVYRSVILERSGQQQAAIAEMRVALESQPEDERLTERLVNLLIAAQQVPEALALVQAQTRTWRWLQWEADLLVMHGDDLTATARYGLALAQLDGRHFLEDDRTVHALQARLLLARAHAFRRLDQLEQAQEHYQQAKALIPDDPAIDFNLGLIKALEGLLDEAIQLCKPALSNASDLVKQELLASLESDERYKTLHQSL